MTDDRDDQSDEPPAEAAAQLAAAEQHMREDPRAFILQRARSEVHLLLDNLSANPDTTIAALSRAAPPKGLGEHWIENVCRITWPPEQSEEGKEEQAVEAALLIRVKDYLNSLSKPASGATIAFTLMVTQEHTPGALDKALGDESGSAKTPSRSSLACEAYPDLLPKAAAFRRWMSVMSWILLGFLAVTCALSWYVAIGNAALADHAGGRLAFAEAEKRVSDAQSALKGRAKVVPPAQQAPVPPPPAAQPPGTQASVQQAAAPQAATPARPAEAVAVAAGHQADLYLSDYCGLGAKEPPTYETAELMDACKALRASKENLARLEIGLDRWAAWWGDEDTARWGVNMLAGAVLPVLYGFLGAAAAILRSLSRKIKASLLSPRDLQLSLQQLALGAVIGACIGLFIASPETGGSGSEMALLGPVALSSSAISFVAGFGVESVFQALEALISRIFNLAPAGEPAYREVRRREPESPE